jgi:hypothetical protein
MAASSPLSSARKRDKFTTSVYSSLHLQPKKLEDSIQALDRYVSKTVSTTCSDVLSWQDILSRLRALGVQLEVDVVASFPELDVVTVNAPCEVGACSCALSAVRWSARDLSPTHCLLHCDRWRSASWLSCPAI